MYRDMVFRNFKFISTCFNKFRYRAAFGGESVNLSAACSIIPDYKKSSGERVDSISQDKDFYYSYDYIIFTFTDSVGNMPECALDAICNQSSGKYTIRSSGKYFFIEFAGNGSATRSL